MRPGEEFEKRCFTYLKEFYKAKQSEFDYKGGMDSTVSDIAVIKNGKIDYFIEAKDSNAQSGQFVLLPDEEKKEFVFSPRNKSEENDMTDIIIEYMNSDFDRFNNAGTAGESLDIDTGVFTNWILEHYSDREVKYFISYYNDFVVFPIRRFAKYFDVLAKYRIKKSGSSEPARKDINAVKGVIENSCDYVIFTEDGKKLFAEFNRTPKQDRFVLGNYTYYLSKQSGLLFEVRKLSNTYNMNVIFSIAIKRGQDPSDLNEFESDL